MRLTVLIPCLDEANTLAKVIAEVRQGLAACGPELEWSEIVVADNGSTDGSQGIALDSGARVVHCPIRGYGAALHWGIVNARGDYVVFGDADMSYDFGLLPQFVDTVAKQGEQDLVLASRLAGEILPGAMPFLNRHMGTPGLNTAIRICFGFKTTDCNSGQRMVRRDFYRELNMRCPGMEWASELLIKSAIRKGRYQEFPGRLRPDERGRPPHMRRWRDGWRHLKSIVMLAPNVAVAGPALALVIAGGALFSWRADLAYAAWWSAYAAALIALAIKLVLHVDRVRPSRIVARFLAGRFAELGIALTVLLLVGGAVELYVTDSRDAAVGGAFLVAAGGLTALVVLLWETVRTHVVHDLAEAWTVPAKIDEPPSSDE